MIKKCNLLLITLFTTIFSSCYGEISESTQIESSSIVPSDSSISSFELSSQESSSIFEESSSESSEETKDPYENYWTYEGNYYDSLDLSLSGEELKDALCTLINTGVENSSYTGLRSAYKYTDVDPENEENIILYYTGESRKFAYGQSSAFQGSINREHVWPQSRYKSLGKKQHNTPYDDIYNVRPSDSSTNSSRGNGLFDYGLNEPEVDSYKGDVARVLLYVATRYKTLSLVDNTSGGDNSMGKLSTLLEWNIIYPVTEAEIRRNNGGQTVQGNRNPYVDNPRFACSIWGSTNETTKKVCGSIDVSDEENAPITAYNNYIKTESIDHHFYYIDDKKKELL